jgi:hypothetical protein
MTHYELFAEVNEYLAADVLPSALFMEACTKLATWVGLCGPALQFAAYDVHLKLSTLQTRLGSSVPHSLFEVILKEQQDGTLDIPSTPSVGRCVQRLSWFLDYAKTLIKHLTQKSSADMELPQCARAAYEECLAPNHNWLTRQAVRLALHACPSRRTFYRAVSDDMAETFKTLASIHSTLEVTVAFLYKFYATHNISKLQ